MTTMETFGMRTAREFDPIDHDTLVPVSSIRPRYVTPGDILFPGNGDGRTDAPVRIVATERTGHHVTLTDDEGNDHTYNDRQTGVTIDGPTVMDGIADAVDQAIRERDGYGLPYELAEAVADQLRQYDEAAADDVGAWAHNEAPPEVAASGMRRLARTARDIRLEGWA